jgi:hypothetical protein
MRYFSRLFVILSAVALVSCGGNPLDVDVSSVNIEPVKIKRLDKDLFAMDTNRIEEASLPLQKKYGSFFEKFVINVINDGGTADTTYGQRLKGFVRDKDMRDVSALISKIYTDEEISKLENELTEAFRHMKFYFPDTSLPKQVLTMMSGFNYNIVNVDSTLAIGLEAYLGKEAPFYDMMNPPIAAYRKRLMDKNYLLADVVAGWTVYKFDRNDPEKNLLEAMIKAGKLFYCTKALIPETEDSVIIGYTKSQMEYCDTYGKDLWNHFTQKDRLFSNDLKEIVAYTADGPFTGAISKECPPAIAKYIGYKIVSAYMKKNSKVTLLELMAERDFQKILNKSKYKPS